MLKDQSWLMSGWMGPAIDGDICFWEGYNSVSREEFL